MKGRPKRITAKVNSPSDNNTFPKKSFGFFDDVFEIVKLVPRGRVTTYGAIAAFLSTGLSARMVGWAMNASHRSIPPIPAHRVVNRNGMLSGRMHFETPTMMEERLQEEGIRIKDNVIIEFDSLFWDPASEIGI